MRILFLLAIVLAPIWLLGQTIDSNRTTVWPSSFVNDIQIPNNRVVTIKHQQDSLQTIMPVDSLLEDAKIKLGTIGGVIFLSPGFYSISKTFELNSNLYLIGAGSANTTLFLNLSGNSDGILAKGKLNKKSLNVADSAFVGSKKLKVLDHQFEVGDLVSIQIADDSLVTSSWAKGSVGQITKVAKVNDSIIVLSDPLRLNLTPLSNPRITLIKPITNCGILNLTLERLDSTKDQTDNVHFELTQNALLYGVESVNCNFAHVNNVGAYQTYIYGSHFQRAFSYGNGGKGYGVVLSFTSSQCIVENNIFDKLRHSILLQAGPNGNVIGYNYSKNPFWTGTALPADLSGDIVFHGNYPFFNLVEGNICQNLVIDDSHGINGPNNTFLRNRMEHAGIFMNFSPASDSQIFIGNEITGSGTSRYQNLNFALGQYFVQGKGHLEFGNNKNGAIIPNNTTADITSLYHSSLPHFWSNETWPPIGPPNTIKSANIPAYGRSSRKLKTIAYPFENPFQFEIISFQVIPFETDLKLKWVITGIEKCKQFEIYRICYPGTLKLVATEECDTSKKLSTFEYVDNTFSQEFKNADSIKYFIVMKHLNGQIRRSDTATLVNDQKLSVHFDENGNWNAEDPGITQLQLYDLKGTLICSLTAKQSLPKNVATGIYYVAVFQKARLINYQKIYIKTNHF